MNAARRRQDLAVECRGCGAITELEQDSDYCWTCTYPEPLCMCAGDSWRAIPDDRHKEANRAYPQG